MSPGRTGRARSTSLPVGSTAWWGCHGQRPCLVANGGRDPEVRSGTIRAAGRCPGAPGTRHRTRRPARWPGRRSSASGDVPTGRRGSAETPDRAPSGSAQLVRRGHAYGGPAPLSRMRTSRRALRLSQSAFAAQVHVPLEAYRPWDAGRASHRRTASAGRRPRNPFNRKAQTARDRRSHRPATSDDSTSQASEWFLRSSRRRQTPSRSRHVVLDHLRASATGRCCMNRHWPARCPPTEFLPADTIRRWSAKGGHPIQDLTAEDDLTPLPGWAPGAKTISDDGLVAEERVLHSALTMVP